METSQLSSMVLTGDIHNQALLPQQAQPPTFTNTASPKLTTPACDHGAGKIQIAG
jgi:hypothetical protein